MAQNPSILAPNFNSPENSMSGIVNNGICMIRIDDNKIIRYINAHSIQKISLLKNDSLIQFDLNEKSSFSIKYVNFETASLVAEKFVLEMKKCS